MCKGELDEISKEEKNKPIIIHKLTLGIFFIIWIQERIKTKHMNKNKVMVEYGVQ